MNNLKYVNGTKMLSNKKNILDQYFTKHSVAKELYNRAVEIISKFENIDKYTWLEPSVGEGCFLDLLPANRRIGIDIDPRRKDVVKKDYLKFELPKIPTIVIGNPPFGHRGVLALEFMKHSREADFICFILPMFFESKGKGSIKNRIGNGFNLIYSEFLKNKSFYMPNGNDVDIKCVFQIWSKKYENNKLLDFSWYNLKDINPFEKYLSIFTVSLAKKRECGKKWIYDERADFYISSTFFKDNKVVKHFCEVKYKSGIAIVFNTKNKKILSKLEKIFLRADWIKYSSLATNSCRHIGKVHIYELLYDNGL